MSSAPVPSAIPTDSSAPSGAPVVRIARAWADRETGVLLFEERGRTTALGFLQGGLAHGSREPDLDRALRSELIRFVPRRAPGEGNRGVVARALLRHALDPRDATWLGDRPAPALTLLVPLPMLEQLGLYPKLRWRPKRNGVETDFDDRAALGVQLRALERLGFARIVAEPEPASAPRLAFAPRRPLTLPPRAIFAEEEDIFGMSDLTDSDGEADDGDLDVDALVEGHEDSLSREALTTGIDLLERGLAQTAEQAFARLRDSRMDNPEVLAWLALARVSGAGRQTPDRVADARAWARMARAMAPGVVEVERILARLDALLRTPGSQR